MSASQDNQKWIEQLQFRAARIKQLIPLQKNATTAQLLQAESAYVEAQIDHRTKHGGIELITP